MSFLSGYDDSFGLSLNVLCFLFRSCMIDKFIVNVVVSGSTKMHLQLRKLFRWFFCLLLRFSWFTSSLFFAFCFLILLNHNLIYRRIDDLFEIGNIKIAIFYFCVSLLFLAFFVLLNERRKLRRITYVMSLYCACRRFSFDGNDVVVNSICKGIEKKNKTKNV